MKFKLLFALMAFAAATASAQSTIVITNGQATINYTNKHFTGVSTLQGKAGKKWVGLQNFFTTERIGTKTLTLPANATNYTEFRVRALSVAPGNAFANLAASYGNIHTVAGSNAVPIGVNGWQPEFEGALATAVNLSNPRQAVANTNGDIYVVEKDRHTVSVIVKATGRIHTIWGTNGPGSGPDFGLNPKTNALNKPSALWLNGSFLYVLDSGNNRVRVLSLLANQVRTLVSDASGITNGSSLWVSPDELEVYYTDGTMLKHWTQDVGIPIVNPATFINLAAVVIDRSGDVGIADRGDNRILQVDDVGLKSSVAGSGFPSGFNSGGQRFRVALPGASSIAFMPTGGFLVGLDQPDSKFGARVWYIDGDNLAAPLVYGQPGIHQGDEGWFRAGARRPKIGTIQSVSVAPSGDIIMVEGNQYIRTIDFLRLKP
ncbi:MAG TPA: hypothetical protein VK846_01765 [Candidatus Limnocylindria bacterium]|nr:hypothetical protein [Candidatus Limnocylindria bacterium]